MSILRSTLNRPTLYTTQVNVTGEFHNLTSSGTFPLPGNDTRSSGPGGAVQLSNGNGGFNNDGQLYVQNGLVLDNSMVVVNTQKPFVLALTSTGQTGYVPNPSVDKDGDIFFGAVQNLPVSFYGYKTGGWVDLAGAGGGGSGSSAPLNSIQFAGAGSVFQSSPLYGFYKGGQNLPSGGALGPDQNALIIGSTAGQGTGLPNATTQISYVSDSTEQVQFVLSKSGLQIELPNSGNNQEFLLETNEIGITPNPPVVIQTRDGNMNFQSFRQTNGAAYGEGSINLLTNSGGIILQSRGENSGGGTTTGVNGGDINLDSQDGNILLHSTRKSSNKSVELRSEGAFSVGATPGILLNSIQAAAGAPSISSGKITLQTEGGSIDLSTTTGSQGLTNSGNINLSTAVGDIKLNAKGIARNIELTAEGSILARTRLEIQDTTNPGTATTTVTIDGASGNITTTGVPGNITTNTGNITATNGTVKGNQLESTTTTEVGTDLTVQNDAIIGNTGGGSFTVKTTNTTVGLPALRTYSAAGVDQTKLNTSLSLMADTSAVLDINGANSRRLVAAGSLAYNSSARLLTYGGLNPAGNLSNKFIGNKVLLKSVEFIQSLSKNNAQNGTPLPYDATATIGGYQSLAVSGNQAGRKCLDLNGNVTAVNISEFSAAGIGGGIVDVFCVKVQMPPRYKPTPTPAAINPGPSGAFENEFSVLVEGIVTIHYPNRSGTTGGFANIGIGVWATDADTPNGSARPAPYNDNFGAGVITTAADAWKWGNKNFNSTGPIAGAAGQPGFSAGGIPTTGGGRVQSGGTNSWPRAMHASYYYNLKENQLPPITLEPGGFGITPTIDRNDSSANIGNPSTAFPGFDPGYIDPLGAPSTNARAGSCNCGSYFRAPIVDNNEYEIAQIPFSIVCQNTNNSNSVQTQYIWVTLFAAQATAIAVDPPADPSDVGDSFGPYVFRDGYYGFGGISSGTSAYRYSGINTCSVYYVGDPDVMSDTTDA